MAQPLTADRVLAALKAEGVTVRERAGWRTHNRNHKGAWGPVNGLIIHHTASGDGTGIIDLCSRGRADLPGPLCHGVIDKSGAVHLVGWGRANHAGAGDGRVLNAVIAEKADLPRPSARDIDGNARFYGFECVNRGDGKDPWPEAQLDAMARAAAALCRAHGWTERSVVGHLEWTNQKIDPRGVSMDSFRGRVGKLLAGKPGERPAPAKPPTPKPTKPGPAPVRPPAPLPKPTPAPPHPAPAPVPDPAVLAMAAVETTLATLTKQLADLKKKIGA